MARTGGGTEVSGASRTGGPMLREALLSLLPTPRAAVDKDHGLNGKDWGELRPALLRLLPTPSATDYGNNQSPSPGAAVRPSLTGALKLLRTPTAAPHNQPGANGGENRAELVSLLRSNGASTPAPSNDGSVPLDGLLENPCFREWLLGAPEGWSDPDCQLSATEFKSRSEGSPASTSSVFETRANEASRMNPSARRLPDHAERGPKAPNPSPDLSLNCERSEAPCTRSEKGCAQRKR
jgi:hypothetical protein